MALSRIKRALTWRYRRFVQRQGFAVMTVICAAIIAGSAAWTQQAGFRRVTPTPPPDAASAADLWQQSLQSAATPVPSPTEAPPTWLSPVGTLEVMRGFDGERLIPTGIAGLWRVHDAVDLAAEADEPVAAMRDGTVLQVTEQSGLGICAVIDHADGFIAEYAGLAATELRAGQRVKAGENIGTAGHAHGTNAPPCLHLRVTQEGLAVDPLPLLPPQQP